MLEGGWRDWERGTWSRSPACRLRRADRRTRLPGDADLARVIRRRDRSASGRGHRLVVREIFTRAYWPGDSPGAHLEFALKYDGTNLALLERIFAVIEPSEIQRHVESKPTGKYARRLWYLYEFLTGRRLPLDDLTRGSYVELLPADDYYTSASPVRGRRQRIHDNLLGELCSARWFGGRRRSGRTRTPSSLCDAREAFSKPLMQLVDYELDEDGRMTVHNETVTWYRYMDLTSQVESLFSFIEKTVDEELKTELAFLANYDRTRRAIQAIVDMPDRHIDLFIRFCLQNNGRLLNRKRKSHFEFLSNEEVAELEATVVEGYGV